MNLLEKHKIDKIGILLPTRGRHSFLLKTLNSLASSSISDMLEVIVVCDNDPETFNSIKEFPKREKLYKFTQVLTGKRMYSVRAFNIALSYCDSDLFIWLADRTTVDYHFVYRVANFFLAFFTDEIGVMSFGGKRNKANFGITTKKFIEYNENEFFSEEYLMNYCDDELACRAVLLGRYAHHIDKGFYIDKSIAENFHLFENLEEKLKLKKIDRGIFYKRTEKNFYLPSEKIYDWQGFRDISLPLKVRMNEETT